MTFLQTYLDPDLKVRADDSTGGIEKEETERLVKLQAVAAAARQIPRRLGGEANDDELTADKQRSRRIEHVAAQCLKAWGGKFTPQDVNREAAQVDWARWWGEHRIWLLNRMRYIATWQYKNGADEKWAKSALVKLSNELQWLQYAMRD